MSSNNSEQEYNQQYQSSTPLNRRNQNDEHSSSQNPLPYDNQSSEQPENPQRATIGRKQLKKKQQQQQRYEAESEQMNQRGNRDDEELEDDEEEDYEEDDDNQRQNKKQIKQRNNLLPFIVESYNKEERQKQRANKPKLGLKRLTDDKKLVSVEIDLPLDQNTVIKDKFDWDLTKDKISPGDFAQEMVVQLRLPQECAQKIRYQILSQIMEHLKANTRQKVQEERDMAANGMGANQQALGPPGMTGNPFNTRGGMRFTYNQYQDDDLLQKQENEKKKMSRMRRNDMKRTNTYLPTQPNRYFKEKKICRNCKNENNAPGFECRNCKLPFQLMEMLNFDDKRVKISVKYYEKIANKIPLLIYQAKKSKFQKQDFDSFYAIYNKIKGIFEVSDELSKQNLNQVKYIMQKYHEYFLNGNLDFNDEEIIYDKDMKKGEKKDDDNRPKRARGRPRKIKIINDDLVPNSNQNSEQDSSESDSESSSYTSS